MAAQRIALVGAGGMLATQLQNYLARSEDYEFIPLGEDQLDITRREAVRTVLQDAKPDWVINGAAFLNADRCEKEPETSYKVNYLAAAQLAQEVAACKARLIHFSSDFVFDGKTGNYNEKDVPLPLSYYGLHKYMADEAMLLAGAPAYILRIASVIGASDGKRDFIKALLGGVAAGKPKLGVVEDLKITMATTQLIARTVQVLITKRPAYGILNTVATGVTTWFDIARVAFDELGVKTPVEPIPASTYPTPAARPVHSNLDNGALRLLLGDVPEWEAALRAQMQDGKESYLALLNQAKVA